MSDSNVIQFPQIKTPPITLDFFMSQLRVALVAVLAYGGGKGWFTPTDATLITALASSLGPIIVPWLWSIFSNLGTIRISNSSAAAVVAKVESVDKESAAAGATNALIANSGNPMTPNVITIRSASAAVLILACALTFLAFSSSAQAQVKLIRPTGNIALDIAAATGSKTTITGAPVTDIQNFLNSKFLPDLQYALKLAQASKNSITADCYQAWIDIITTQQTAVKNADGTDIAMPDPHVITEFEKLVELRNALQPESPFMIKCSPVASMVKLDIAKFMGVVISGGAGLATLVPGL